MNSTRSVAIYCEFGDGRAIPKGTGIEVFEGVFLTAKHTLYKDFETGTELRASSVSIARPGKTLQVDNNHFPCVNTYEHPTLDFAIVETDAFKMENVGSSYFEIPSDERNGKISEGQLFGFPAIAEVNGTPTQISLRATCSGTMLGGVFQLDIPLAPTKVWLSNKSPKEIDAALRGLSGAGIIHEGSLVGIILRKKENVGHYEALCLGWLRKNDEWFQGKIERYRNSLVGNKEIELGLREIRDELGIDVKASVYPNSTEGLKDTLLHLWEHLDCTKNSDEKLMKISALAKAIFCWFFSKQIGLVGSSVKTSYDGKWSFPTRHWCGVEAFMAGLEGRRLELRATGTAYDPAGKKNLSVPPPPSYSQRDPDKHHEIAGQLWLDLKKYTSATELSNAISNQLDRTAGGVTTDGSTVDEKLHDILTYLSVFHSKKKFHFSFREHTGVSKSSIDEAVSDYRGLVPAIQMQSKSDFDGDITPSIIILAKIMQKTWVVGGTNDS